MPSTSTDAAALVERYGAPSRWRRVVLVAAIAVLVVSFLGWLTWTIVSRSSPQVTSELETYSIRDDHTAEAVLVVHLHDSGVVATCTLTAYAADHTVVGNSSFTPDPGTARQVREVRTERRATTVESQGCTAAGQTRPR